MNSAPQNILISRTDSIGDVMLTLPLAGILKEKYPDASIQFLGRNYTKDIIQCCQAIDVFHNWDTWDTLPETEAVATLKTLKIDAFIHVFPRKEVARLAKKAGISMRIGTARRLFHLTTCTDKLNFTRKKSDLHEAQLNTKLLEPLGIKQEFSLHELVEYYHFQAPPTLANELEELLQTPKLKIILHPKSKGSAVEWGLANFAKLIKQLSPENYHVFVTGTEEEGQLFREHLPLNLPNVTDVSGKMSLNDLITFIAKCDTLIAASTGPLHIAAACGIKAIGLFAPRKPIHPGRWQPLGKQATALTFDDNCTQCTQGKECSCIEQIEVEQVCKLL